MKEKLSPKGIIPADNNLFLGYILGLFLKLQFVFQGLDEFFGMK